MKSKISHLLQQAVENLKSDQLITQDYQAKIQVDHTKDASHGDLATNLALVMGKAASLNPREMANRLIAAFPASDLIEKVEIAGPGFINFFLKQTAASQIIHRVLNEKYLFGHTDAGAGQKAQVEYVSANPTGPLHIGHGRAAVVGDCLARILEATGWKVTREYYYNDAGQQIANLGLSVQARAKGILPGSEQWQPDWYQGHYIQDVAQDYLAKKSVEAADKQVTALGDIDNLEAIQEFAVAYLRREQDQDLKAFDVDFDVYFLESSLYKNGDIEKTVETLMQGGHTYEQDGALWLRTSDYGDDKDRVMRKSGGGYTYFLPDVAYHANKWNRGFKRVVDEFGADHHSTVARVKAGLQALNMGIPKDWPEVVLHQMVTVMRGHEEVKISKRAGSYVTLRDIIDEVGKDATRYFLAARRSNSQMTFDLELAASQTNDNPVYYIQYAHARICSAFRKLEEMGKSYDQALGLQQLALLTLAEETSLMDKLSQFPELISVAATNLEPHIIAHYLRELASGLHGYYQVGQNDENGRWIVENHDLCQARMTLIDAVRQVFANGLNLLGVSAPEKM